jgi:hypothetical protein
MLHLPTQRLSPLLLAGPAQVGFARPIDILTLREQQTTIQACVDLLNGLYGAGTYARGK